MHHSNFVKAYPGGGSSELDVEMVDKVLASNVASYSSAQRGVWKIMK